MKRLLVFLAGILAGIVGTVAGFVVLDEHDRNTRWGRLK
jgi:hypothetical protein